MAKATLDKGGILMSSINKHIHLSAIELKQYIEAEHELTQANIEQIELELQMCEVCLDTYIGMLEHSNIPVQQVVKEQHWETLLAKIEEHEHSQITIPVKKKWYEHSIVHVVAAASITGMLFISGLLSFMTSIMLEEDSESLIKVELEVDSAWYDLKEQQWAVRLEEQLLKFKQITSFERED